MTSLNLFAVPPKFLQEPQDVVAVEGQDILVPCVVEGFPDPVIKWHHEPGSREVPGKSESGSDPGDAFLAGMTMNQQFPNGSLLLTLATKSMEGAYTCTATNGVKYDIRKTINVTVNGKKEPPRKLNGTENERDIRKTSFQSQHHALDFLKYINGLGFRGVCKSSVQGQTPFRTMFSI